MRREVSGRSFNSNGLKSGDRVGSDSVMIIKPLSEVLLSSH